MTWTHNRLRSLLVVSEIALSLVALIGAGLFVRSMQHAQQLNPGFLAENLFQVPFDLGTLRYDREHGLQFFREAIERAKSVPGVLSASVSSDGIFGGTIAGTVFREGEQADPNNCGTPVSFDDVTPSHFDTLRVPLLSGRDFTDFDRDNSLPVVVINDAMAKLIWPHEDPLGKHFSLFGNTTAFQVIGVAGNTVVNQIGEDPQPVTYFPLRQQFSSVAVLEVRTSDNPQLLLGAVRDQVQQIDRNLALINPQTASDLLGQGLGAARMGAAMLGLFGVLAYSVAQRTAEIGIRMALGAQPNQVLQLVLKQGMLLASVGCALGIMTALLISRPASNLLYGVSATDPLTYAGITVLLMSVAFLACYIPARRATRIDPIVALRFD